MPRTALLAAALLALALTPHAPADHVEPAARVAVHAFTFVDDATRTSITVVPVGGTVLWYEVAGQHTVTSHDGAFDARVNAFEPRFEHTFDEPGAYPYRCIYHPTMQGVVVVVAAAADA